MRFWVLVIGLVLSACQTTIASNESDTLPNTMKAQTRLDEISAPLMQAWERHCEDGLAGLVSKGVKCKYEVLVRADTVHNAYADGTRVFVTSGMINAFSDISLSLVIAHEMAHNVLGHVDMDIAESRERAADRWALYLLQAAGLDYVMAAQAPEAVHALDANTKTPSSSERRRRTHFDAVIEELSTKE